MGLSKIIEKIKARLTREEKQARKSVWGRYAKFTMPLVTALVLIINCTIFYYVSGQTQSQVEANAKELVELQTSNIERMFESNMHTMLKIFEGFSIDRIDEYMAKANVFIKENPDLFAGYVRLTFRDGRSYTSNKGLDSLSFKGFSIPRRILDEHEPLVMTSPYLPTDNVKTNHYGINYPLVVNDSVVAVITTTIPKNTIDKPVSKLNLNGHGAPGIIHNGELIVVFVDNNINGTIFFRDKFESYGFYGLDKALDNSQTSKNTGKCVQESYTAVVDDKPTDVTIYSSYIKNTDWGVTMSIIKSEHNSNVNILMVIMIILSLTTIVTVYFGLRYITRQVVLTPTDKANDFAKDLSEGLLYSNAIDNIEDHNEFGKMKASMKAMKNKVESVVTDIRDHAGNINTASDTLINLVEEMDSGAQTQAVSTEEISAAIENITTSVQQINDNAYEAANISGELKDDISRIAEFSRDTLDTIENVISKIAVINDITQRTDMLAINASAEAARAGKYGVGFAQVAGEIRKLAIVCQTASQEINALSAQSLKITQHVVNQIASIEPRVKSNAEMVTEISNSCGEQISKANSMATHVQQLVEVTASNSSNAEELSRNVDKLKASCRRLVQSVEFFKLSDKENSRQQLIDDIQECTNKIAALRDRLTNINQKKN